MLPSYVTILKTLTDEYYPSFKGGGTGSLLDVTLGPTWNGLMSKDGSDGILRVVSAWHGIMEDGVTQNCAYDEWADDIASYVEQDLGKEIAATDRYDVREHSMLYWSFAILFQAFGDDWPTEALTARILENEDISKVQGAALTEVIWEHALREYRAFKALQAKAA